MHYDAEYVHDRPPTGSANGGGDAFLPSPAMYDMPQPRTLHHGIHVTITLSDLSLTSAHTRAVRIQTLEQTHGARMKDNVSIQQRPA